MAFIQGVQFVTGSATNGLASPAMTVTAGNYLVILQFDSYAACAVSAADSLGNTLTKHFALGTQVGSANANGVFNGWTAPIVSGGSCVITLSAACGSNLWGVVMEYSGLASSPFDQAATSLSSTTSISAGPVTTTTDGQLIFGQFVGNAGGTVFSTDGSSTIEMTENVSSRKHIVQDRTQTTAGSISSTCTGSGVNFALFPADGLIATFKQSSGTPATIVAPNLLMMGVGH